MSKVLVMVRVSTEGQDTTDQRNEMLDFVQQQGYSENDIVWIEDKGASAIKLNEKYLAMIDQIKDEIDRDNTINCLALWHINRGFRNEVVFYQLKDFLIENKIQLLVKNPYLKLLNDDGSVNAGTELAFSLLITLAKQDMVEKKAKFTRAKKGNAENHKFNGGWSTKFGYRIDEDGYVVPDPDDSKVVQEIFQLYSTGLYSTRSLSYELQSRGIEPSTNSLRREDLKSARGSWIFHPNTIMRILGDTSYIGYSNSDHNRSHRKYIPIISQELWDKVAEIRDKNSLHIARTGKIQVGQKILVCPVCGSKLFVDGHHYACHNHRKKSMSGGAACDNSMAVKSVVADGLIWLSAYKCEDSDSKIRAKEKHKEDKETIKIIYQKQKTLKHQLIKQEERKKKIVDAYLEDLITKEERDRRLNNLARAVNENRAQILHYERQIFAITKRPDSGPLNLPATLSLITNNDDLKTAQKIARKHIKSCIVTRDSYGIRDSRSTMGNVYHFIVTTYLYGEHHYMYFPRKYQGHQLYHYDPEQNLILSPISGV